MSRKSGSHYPLSTRIIIAYGFMADAFIHRLKQKKKTCQNFNLEFISKRYKLLNQKQAKKKDMDLPIRKHTTLLHLFGKTIKSSRNSRNSIEVMQCCFISEKCIS
jgi:hypothetical protein